MYVSMLVRLCFSRAGLWTPQDRHAKPSDAPLEKDMSFWFFLLLYGCIIINDHNPRTRDV